MSSPPSTITKPPASMTSTTFRLVSLAAWLLVILLGSSTEVLAANCPCGFTDPTTGAVWTDAILTYFNETGAATEIVTTPTLSPYIEGQKSAGDTGTGAQDWTVVGGQTDPWEDAFGATYRRATLLNNTAIEQSQLQMAVQPAERSNRIVYGSECECADALSFHLDETYADHFHLQPSLSSHQSSLAVETSSMAPFERHSMSPIWPRAGRDSACRHDTTTRKQSTSTSL